MSTAVYPPRFSSPLLNRRQLLRVAGTSAGAIFFGQGGGGDAEMRRAHPQLVQSVASRPPSQAERAADPIVQRGGRRGQQWHLRHVGHLHPRRLYSGRRSSDHRRRPVLPLPWVDVRWQWQCHAGSRPRSLAALPGHHRRRRQYSIDGSKPVAANVRVPVG